MGSFLKLRFFKNETLAGQDAGAAVQPGQDICEGDTRGTRAWTPAPGWVLLGDPPGNQGRLIKSLQQREGH